MINPRQKEDTVDILEQLWVEKYRPKSINNVITPHKDHFSKYISERNIPHLLFFGPPGSGKTTVAKIISSAIAEKDDILEFNGSAKETRGIDFVQNTIEAFLRIPPSQNSKYRIIFIDEADYLTHTAFNSLRHIMEKYEHGRFILTCNYINKIPDPIQSRCQKFNFKSLESNEIKTFLMSILDNENIEYDNLILDEVIENLYPDVRSMINFLQRHIKTNQLDISEGIQDNEFLALKLSKEIVAKLAKKELDNIVSQKIKQLVDILEYDTDYHFIYTKLFDDKEVPFLFKILINQYANTHSDSLLPKMHFMALIYELVKLVKS